MLTKELHPSARTIAADLRDRLREHFGRRLIGLYAYGSAVYGDFLPGVSDIDSSAVLNDDPNDSDLAALGRIHDRLAADYPEWAGRIEVQYVSRDALRSFRMRRH